MKKYLISILFALLSVVLPLPLSAQQQAAANMSVKSFKMVPTDNTANLQGTIVYDQNGDKCALIRVQTTETGFAFDCGQMKPCKIEYKVGEVWVYVPYGVKRMTIRHPKLGTLADYSFPVPVEKARTYNMELLTAQIVTTVVAPLVTSQYVVFTVTPEDARVELDGELLAPQNGIISKLVKLGVHKYKVTKKNYHDFQGTVDVNDMEKSVSVKVALKPAFGYIKFTQEFADAIIFIDGEEVKIVPSTPMQIAGGRHEVRVTKPMYQPLITTVDVVEEQTLLILPTMKPNYKIITIPAATGAEVWLNGIKVGTGSWTGKIEKGPCRIEIRKEGYRTVVMEKDIDPDMSESVITPPSPIPVYGALQIETSPAGVTVTLDSKEIGTTPLMRSNVLVGRHTLTFSAKGYETVTKEIVVEEGKIWQGSHVMKTPTAPVPVPVQTNNDAVDLGLSVKWASCNLGASKPEEYGRYFAWGDVKGQARNGSKWSGGGYSTDPSYKLDSKGNLLPQYDAAHVLLGGSWRMPTKAEQQELIDNCTCTWTSNYKGTGVAGRIFTSKKSGYTDKSIFLPAAGGGAGSSLYDAGSRGRYWSSTFGGGSGAWGLGFDSDNVGTGNYYRYYGFSVRAVSE